MTFRQWISVDRCSWETLEKPSDKFIDMFCSKLEVLIQHDIVAKQQTSYMKKVKENIHAGEFAVTLDFAENRHGCAKRSPKLSPG